MCAGNSNYDWVFTTTPQLGGLGRTIPLPRYIAFAFYRSQRELNVLRGKMLGGSTGLNYMAWHRANKVEYDSWSLLADKKGAWDWDSFLPYLKKVESAGSASDPTDPYPALSRLKEDVFNSRVPISEVLGAEGLVKVSPFADLSSCPTNFLWQTGYSPIYSDVVPPFIKAWNALEQGTNANPVCFLLTETPFNLDPDPNIVWW